MTREQQATIDRLRERRYTVRVIRTGRNGTLLCTLKCRLTEGNMPLRIYSDGDYMPPWYDPSTPRNRKVLA